MCLPNILRREGTPSLNQGPGQTPLLVRSPCLDIHSKGNSPAHLLPAVEHGSDAQAEYVFWQHVCCKSHPGQVRGVSQTETDEKERKRESEDTPVGFKVEMQTLRESTE